MQPLEVPASRREVVSQPIQKFRMRWTVAQMTEVRRRSHNAAAEMQEPDAIDQHAADEWMLPRHQATGVRQASPGGRQMRIVLGDFAALPLGHAHGQIAGYDLVLWLLEI